MCLYYNHKMTTPSIKENCIEKSNNKSQNNDFKNQELRDVEHVNDRLDDMITRGRGCLVHDYDGHVVKLKNAKVWYNHDGDYVAPRSSYGVYDNILFNFSDWLKTFMTHVKQCTRPS